MSTYFHPNFIRGDVKSILKICPSSTAPKPYQPLQIVSENHGEETRATSSRGSSNSTMNPSENNKNGNGSSLAALLDRNEMERYEQEKSIPLVQYSFMLQQPHQQQPQQLQQQIQQQKHQS